MSWYCVRHCFFSFHLSGRWCVSCRKGFWCGGGTGSAEEGGVMNHTSAKVVKGNAEVADGGTLTWGKIFFLEGGFVWGGYCLGRGTHF